MYCDLHLHSTASDGTDAPEAIPTLAKRVGLGAIALTDHDTAAGVAACAAVAKKARIKFVPGIELSADPASIAGEGTRLHNSDPESRSGTLHILGYFIRPDDPDLAAIQRRLVEARAQRNPEMIDRLNELGVQIDYDEVFDAAVGPSTGAPGSGSEKIVGRPHIAQVLIRKGYVKSIHEAFARYIGEGGAAYVRKDRLPAAEAIQTIHRAGGLAVLAHPVQIRAKDPDGLEHLVARLKDFGLDGIETRHSDHGPDQAARFEKLAGRLDLVPTGGSDYHGSRKAIALGGAKVPMQVYDRMVEAHG